MARERKTTPLQIFAVHNELGSEREGPRDVRVFEKGAFMYGSYDHGREQILDVRMHDKRRLLQYWMEFVLS